MCQNLRTNFIIAVPRPLSTESKERRKASRVSCLICGMAINTLTLVLDVVVRFAVTDPCALFLSVPPSEL